MTLWRFHNCAWQPQCHNRLPKTSWKLFKIHRGCVLTNQRCSLATGCGIKIFIYLTIWAKELCNTSSLTNFKSEKFIYGVIFTISGQLAPKSRWPAIILKPSVYWILNCKNLQGWGTCTRYSSTEFLVLVLYSYSWVQSNSTHACTRTHGQVLRYSYEYWYSMAHLRCKGENHHTCEINSMTYQKRKVPNWFILL